MKEAWSYTAFGFGLGMIYSSLYSFVSKRRHNKTLEKNMSSKSINEK